MQFLVESNIEDFANGLSALDKAMTRELRKEFREGAKSVAQEARSLLRQRGASGPGQPPSRRSGALAKSIRFRAYRRAVGAMVFENDSKSKPYGLFLELSKEQERRTRRRGSRGVLHKRPFLATALDRKSDEIYRKIERALSSVLERA